ncbi:putative aryl-alcohol dehydrogenase aad14 [Marasmius sp. AFHP31]|nr:putative aryl-alcohol dehydrogenase aad14 [Marasmius sp. AFHP31]
MTFLQLSLLSLVALAQALVPRAPTCSQSYTVQSGDTCAAIDKKFGLPTGTVISQNSAVNSGCTNLYIGQSLCVALPSNGGGSSQCAATTVTISQPLQTRTVTSTASLSRTETLLVTVTNSPTVTTTSTVSLLPTTSPVTQITTQTLTTTVQGQGQGTVTTTSNSIATSTTLPAATPIAGAAVYACPSLNNYGEALIQGTQYYQTYIRCTYPNYIGSAGQIKDGFQAMERQGCPARALLPFCPVSGSNPIPTTTTVVVTVAAAPTATVFVTGGTLTVTVET